MNISLLVGGLILFIYSSDLLNNNLLKLSVDKIKNKLEKFTSSLNSSILTGFISTAIIQSSSALIMITIALINANLLTFNQSIGIVLGSNVATTLTSFIIGLNIENFSSFIMLISSLFLNNKNKKISKVAKVLFSIGMLFFSIFIISFSIENLSKNVKLYSYINKVSDNYFLSLLAGILLTTALQSSSIFIAIIQILAMSGFITVYQAIPMIFGANIGTSFDPLLTFYKDAKESKKLTHFSICFNVLSAIIFSLLIKPFKFILEKIILLLNANTAANIALINILFNVLSVLIIIPFINKIKRYYSKW